MDCDHTITTHHHTKTLTLNCRACTHGASSLSDPVCRQQIFTLLRKHRGTTQLILNHTIVKVYTNTELATLHALTAFIDRASTYHPTPDSPHHAILDTLTTDPIQTHRTLTDHLQHMDPTDPDHHLLTDLDTHFPRLIKEDTPTDAFYAHHLRPYVRPGFIDSYIHLHPPPDTHFLESYDVTRPGGRPTHITLYAHTDKPEKLYFIVPPEYTLPKHELHLLETLRTTLAAHRPTDTTFLDATHAEDYFKHLAATTLATLTTTLPPDRLDYLADTYARYTAGLGILEDLLLDHRIQDIYINAPSHHNPIHLVHDGEEYTTNIYLSDTDIDALASKFRAISARAFSEASPVLDMDLPAYHTRIAAISNPLTPRGIAFALRRHRPHPWTLAHFIKNHMLTPAAAGLLSLLVDGQATLLIAGSRGAGKTSLLTALLLEIPQRYRILTIEDTPELPVQQLQDHGYKLQSLITRSIATHATSLEIDPTDALRTALRLGESVLILGEVRGLEAKVLFEAMRIGAAGNLIMGTIHGATTRDVYERVVYDIGVPPTSFKAVDAIIIAAPIRKGGGIERHRRITQISETAKTGWTTTPDPDKVFHDLMTYDAATDTLHPTDLLDMGQSLVISTIAKKWGISIEDALANIHLRAAIKQTMVDHSATQPLLLEAAATRDANNALWLLIEQARHRKDTDRYHWIRHHWDQWFTEYRRGLA